MLQCIAMRRQACTQAADAQTGDLQRNFRAHAVLAVQVFTSEFVGGWLGFFTSPELLLYGVMWNNFPGGMWQYRWGDQQFWKTAVGLFDDGAHVEDVSYVRMPPLQLNETSSKHFLGLLHHD